MKKNKIIRIIISILILILLIIFLKGCALNNQNEMVNKGKVDLNLKDVSKINGARETKKPVINKDGIDLEFILPEKDSSIKYSLIIKNNTDSNKTLDELIIQMLNNSNIDYEIKGANKGDILKPGEEKEIEIIFKNKGEGSDDVIKVKVDYTTKTIYLIKYDLDGGTGDIKNIKKEKEKVVTLSNIIPVKPGYIFKGYAKEKNGEVVYNSGDKYKENKDITLYAIYEPIKYSISYIGNGNTSGNMTDSIHNYGTSSKLKNNTYLKKGYTFIGWSRSINGNKEFDNLSNIMNLSDKNNDKINLYAIWQKTKYTLTVKLNGGVVDNINQDFTRELFYEDTFQIGIPYKLGYTFSNYSLNSGNVINSINGVYTLTMNDSDMFLQANYNPNVYEIKLTNDGDISKGTSLLYEKYDSGIYQDKTLKKLMNKNNHPIDIPKKSGNLFNGYYTLINGKEVKLIDKKGYITNDFKNNIFSDNKEIYAKWKSDVLKIKLDTQSDDKTATKLIYLKYKENFYLDETLKNQMSEVSSSIIIPKNIGHIFKGYYTKPNKEGTLVINENGFILPNTNNLFDEDTILYASYDANVYEILLNDLNQKIYFKYLDGLYLDENITRKMSAVTNPIEINKNAGYVFKGFYTEPDGNGEKIIEENGFVVSNLSNKQFNKNTNLYSYFIPITYKIKYNSNNATDGNMSDSTHKYNEKKALTKNSYTKKGHTFIGWSKNSNDNIPMYLDEEEVINLTNENNEQINLYAIWQQNNYTITTNLDGGVINNWDIPINVTYGQVINLPIPSKIGYTFDKWIVEGEGSTINGNSLVVGNENIKITATYKVKSYEIILDSEEATDKGTTSLYAKYNDGIYLDKELNNRLTSSIPIEIPKKEGYIFNGYYYNDILIIDQEGKLTSEVNNITNFENLVFYANWEIKKYEITFINEGVEYKKEEVEYNKNITAIENPSKEYYNFEYWSLSVNGGRYDLTTPVTEDITLYAVYSIKKYTVKIIDKGQTISETSVEAGSLITLPEENPSKEGHTFLYWSKSINGERYDLNNPVIEDITLYSVYEINKYNIEFYDKEEKIKTIKVNYDNVINESDVPTVVAEEGYVFVGWYEENEEETYNFEEHIKGNKKLYSKYEKIKNAVVFNDENRIETVKIEYGTTIEPIESKGKIGYTFLYWSKSINGEAYNFETNVTEGITLYAVYEKNKYKVTFINEGSKYDEKEIEYNENIEIPNSPSKEGYTFLHWSTSINGDGYDLATVVTENITLYAVYEINSYNIEFYDKNKLIKTIEVTYDSSVPTEKVPDIESEEGFTFMGWYEASSSTTFDFEESIKENIKLYSKYEKIKNSVVFNDENRIETVKIEYGTTIEPIESKGKTGYTFLYWSKSVNGEAYNFDLPITESITLYAVYEKNKYKVTFINEGSKYYEKEIEYNKNIEVPSNPEKEGYTFLHWSKSINEEEYNLTTPVTEDITLYAVYEIKKYEITFINEGVEYKKEEVEYNKNITAIENPSKEYYNFEYWSLSVNGGRYDLTTPVTEDITLYAVYSIKKYTVKIIDKGQTISETSVEAGSLITLPEENPSKEGHTFLHYSNIENGEEYDLTVPVTENVTLYSVYEINKYNIEFYDKEEKIKTIKINYDNVINESDVPTVVAEEGYTFMGWYEENEEETYNFEEHIKGNKKLYSKYEKIKNAVVFNDENRIETVKIEYGTTIEPIESKGKIGYTFKHWSLSINGEAYNFETNVTEGITLYAVYEKNKYKVTFINEGSKYDEKEIEYNKNIEVPSNPEKEGYTFLHWSTSINGEGYDLTTLVTENITLYAVYEINSYEVIFINGNVTYGEKQTIDYGEKITEPINSPSKEGYTFLYWSKSINGEAYNFDLPITESITLYAVYEKNKYKVTFINEEIKYDEKEIEYNLGIEVPSNPSKEGYSFSHWSLTKNGINYDLTTPVTENITLYAVYTINNYKLTINPNGGSWENNTEVQIFDLNYKETKEISVPQREGYTFTGWTKTGNGEMNSLTTTSTFTMKTENTSLIASWEITSHVLTINPNGGSWENNTEVQTFDLNYKETKEISVPQREGYTFTGWTKTGNGEMNSLTTTSTFTMKTENTSLIASWEITSHVLTINPNGGSWENNTEVQIFDLNYKETKEISVPQREGYTFTGWTKTGNGEMNSLTTTSTFTMKTENTSLVANYNANVYEIFLDNKSADISGTTKIYEKYEVGLYSDSDLTSTISRINIPEKSGYTFKGYYTNENCEGEKLIDENGNITNGLTYTKYKRNVTLYAGYQINSYNLTIDYNDGVTASDISILDYKATKEILVPSKEGYVFTGWTLTGNGSTMSSLIENATFTMGTENATLTANYSPITYQIKYDGNGSTSGSMSNSTHTYNVDKNLTTNAYLKTGHTFKGWMTSSNGASVTYTDGQSVKNLSSTNNKVITLYAKWDINSYKLTVNPNEGSWNSNTNNQEFTLNYNETKTISDPSKTGYTFTEWTVLGDGSSIDSGTFTMGYANTSLTANYTANKYTITLNNQSATSAGTTTIYEVYEDAVYLDSNKTKKMTSSANAITIPTKTGYMFGGYYTQAEGKGDQMINEKGNITANLTNTKYTAKTTLYAKWTRITASLLEYDNSKTKLNCNNVQCAIDEINKIIK